MKKLMLFLLLLFSINVTAQNVVDSVSVAETDDGKQLWGKTLELNKNIQSVATYDSLVMVLACDTTKKGKPMTSGHLYALNAENLDVLWGETFGFVALYSTLYNKARCSVIYYLEKQWQVFANVG